jgi:hypothetical protein
MSQSVGRSISGGEGKLIENSGSVRRTAIFCGKLSY